MIESNAPLPPGPSASSVGVPPTIAPPPAAPVPSSGRTLISLILSLCLLTFLLDAICSFADDSLSCGLHVHALASLRFFTSSVMALFVLLTYLLMGVTPLVPKRYFLPLCLFPVVTTLGSLIPLIFIYRHISQVSWLISLAQVFLASAILYALHRELKWHWPLVPDRALGERNFVWWLPPAFLVLNLFVALPLLVIYLFSCSALAVGHFTGGFLALHPSGLAVEARKYVRDDGKTIELYPMAHVADAKYYQQISAQFPTNSLILMEGVTDEQNLITNKISYKRMAKSLGLSEQKQEFHPTQGTIVPADIDVDQFSRSTIDILNLAMLIHGQGATPQNIQALLDSPITPDIGMSLFHDLLEKRNEHLFGEIRKHLTEADYLVIPWGAAHMPGIAADIQKAGFHLAQTHRYTVIRFGSHNQ